MTYPPKPSWFNTYYSTLLNVVGAGLDRRVQGDHAQILVTDISGRGVYESIRKPVEDFLKDPSIPLHTESTRGLRVWLTLYRYRFGLNPTKGVIRVKVRFIVSNSTVFLPAIRSIPTVSSSLKLLRARVRFPVYRNRVPFPKRKTTRPNPESVILPYRVFRWDSSYGTYQDTTSNITNFYRTWTGTVTPNFGAVKASGHLPVNPHSVFLFDIDETQWFRKVEQTFVPYEAIDVKPLQQVYGSGPNMPWYAGHNSSVTNRAIKRLIQRSGNQIDANLAQDTAQIGQMASMISMSARRITNAVRSIKRDDLIGAVNSLWSGTHRSTFFRPGGGPKRGASLANNWLELQYGWKPLLQDVEGGMRSLAQYLSKYDADMFVRASASMEKWVESPQWDDQNHKTMIGMGLTQYRSSCRFVIRYRIGNQLRAFLAQTGFSNPINLAWEVLPWSFVVDWFLPIGPYLEAITAWDGLTFVEGCQTNFTKNHLVTVIDYYGHLPGVDARQTFTYKASRTQDVVYFDRVKLTTFPSLDMPRFKSPVSVGHALNALALLRQVFK